MDRVDDTRRLVCSDPMLTYSQKGNLHISLDIWTIYTG